MTPTARSMQFLKETGWLVAKVEQRLPIPGMFVTRDCFGFGDLLAIHPWGSSGTTALIQVTSAAHVNERIRKIQRITAASVWLKCGNRIIVHGWSKKGKKGQRKTWQLTEREVEL